MATQLFVGERVVIPKGDAVILFALDQETMETVKLPYSRPPVDVFGVVVEVGFFVFLQVDLVMDGRRAWVYMMGNHPNLVGDRIPKTAAPHLIMPPTPTG